MSRAKSLQVERLEDRSLPAVYGIPWHDPSHLSISFAPDGTAIAGQESDLHSSLGATASAATWQRTVLEAYQAWAAHANLNFGIRVDSGDTFGAPGLVQLDPRFGDIRIGGTALSPEVLAVAAPPDPAVSGTWSGDVLFNTSYRFDGDPYALFAVALHEAGHSLGLANSASPDSAMFTRYDQTRTSLSAEDVVRIQSLYGARAPDAYEGARGNDARGRAAALPVPTQYKGETPLVAFGDVTTAADVDFYKFTVPTDGNNDDRADRTVTVRLQSAGASLLAPRLRVTDANGGVLAHRVSTSITGDVLQVQVNDLTEGATYFVKVQAARADAFAVGRYGVSVRFDNTSSVADPVIDELLRGPFTGLDASAVERFFRNSGDVLVSPEEVTDTRATATAVAGVAGYGGTRFEAVGSITKKEDVDLFRVVAPAAGGVLTATVWTPDATGFRPTVSVFDARGRAVATRVLANGNGTSTVQLDGATGGATYFFKVALDPAAGQDKGNYLFSASFGAVASPQTEFARGTLTDGDRTDTSRFYVGEAQLFHFVLTGGAGKEGTAVRLTISDASGAVAHRIEAPAGRAASAGTVLLRPGAYQVRIELLNPSGAPITYTIQGGVQSNPVGPATIDPTLLPQYVVPPPPTAPTGPTNFAYPPVPLTYNPTTLPGYLAPGDPTTYPPGFVLPPDLAQYPWLLYSTDPFYWLALGY